MKPVTKFIVLVGTPSEGFAAYGPYESFDAAEEAHPYFNAFVLGLEQVSVNETTPRQYAALLRKNSKTKPKKTTKTKKEKTR